MTPTLTRLLEAIEEAEAGASVGRYGYDVLTSESWSSILELAAKVREELNAVPQEDVAGRMERE